MKTTYTTRGTCSRFIDIEINGDMIEDINFIGGCAGNTRGLSRLLKGMNIQEVILRLRGIECRGNTSCPDQLAQALEAMVMSKAS